MKKLLTFSIATTALTLSTFAQTFSESFDYGTGVTGRTDISTGDSLNGVQGLDGTATWSSSGTAQGVIFAGAEGAGNGELDMTTTGNSKAKISYDFSNGIVNATVDFTMTTQGSSGAAGLYFGFESSTPDNGLMTNALTDTIWIKVSPGNIGFRTQIEGIRENDTSSISWTSGDSGSMNISYDLSSQSVTATVTQGGTEIYSESMTFALSSEYTPDLGKIALNTVAMGPLTVQDINVIPEPKSYAALFGVFALTATVCRRNRK